MGNHSNKKPLKKPKVEPSFKDLVSDINETNIHPEVPISPPRKEVTSEEFNFHSGNLGTLKRIVARHKLKDRIAFLETVIKVHQPLIQAMKLTQKAFQDGVMEGIRQVAAAEREKEQKAAKEAEEAAKAEAAVGPTVETLVEERESNP